MGQGCGANLQRTERPQLRDFALAENAVSNIALGDTVRDEKPVPLRKAETCETQTWLDLSVACGYISKPVYSKLNKDYDNILGKLVNMRTHPEKWSIKK